MSVRKMGVALLQLTNRPMLTAFVQLLESWGEPKVGRLGGSQETRPWSEMRPEQRFTSQPGAGPALRVCGHAVGRALCLQLLS